MTLHKAAALAFALSLAAPVAQAVVVNLDVVPFNSGDLIETVSPGYSSEGLVTLNWNPLSNNNQALSHWNGIYSSRDAAKKGGGENCALDLTVAATHTVTLASLQLGGWPDSEIFISWSVMDLATNSLVAGILDDLIDGTLGLTASVERTSTIGFRILFGPDGLNGGINDITYSYTPRQQPAARAFTCGRLADGCGSRALAALRRRKPA
jgi:hypothetical protein